MTTESLSDRVRNAVAPGTLVDRAREALEDRTQEALGNGEPPQGSPAKASQGPEPAPPAPEPTDAPEAPPTPEEPPMPSLGLESSYALLPLSQVLRAPANVRSEMDPDKLAELAASIVEEGLLQPITVEPDFDRSEPDVTRYRVVYGSRRREAVEMVGLLGIPCIIRPGAPEADQDRSRLRRQLIENVQREDLSPLDEARGYQDLKSSGLDQTAIAVSVGRSQAHISKRLSLLKLPKEALAATDAGELSLEAAQELSRLPVKAQRELFEEAKDSAGNAWGRQTTVSDYVKTRVPGELEAIEKEKTRARLEKELEAGKTKVVKETSINYLTNWDTKGPVQIGKGYGKLEIETPKAHVTEPCHRVFLDRSDKVRPACSSPATHKRGGKSELRGKIGGYASAGSVAKEDPQVKARRLEKERVQAKLDEVEKDRMTFALKAIAGVTPADCLELLALDYLAQTYGDSLHPAEVAEAFGVDFKAAKGRGHIVGGRRAPANVGAASALTAWADTETKRARMLAVAIVPNFDARQVWDWQGRLLEAPGLLEYLAWLERHGYEPDELEKAIAEGRDPLANWKPPEAPKPAAKKTTKKAAAPKTPRKTPRKTTARRRSARKRS